LLGEHVRNDIPGRVDIDRDNANDVSIAISRTLMTRRYNIMMMDTKNAYACKRVYIKLDPDTCRMRQTRIFKKSFFKASHKEKRK
jgi:hypothetical protein